jgi:hypothetical protein
MKTKYVYVTTAVLCIFVLLVIFKLNSYYKDEKTQTISSQMLQQNLSLKTSISTQLGQLKNILSAYTYRIDESKLNWAQMDGITVLAQTHISKTNQFEVKNIFTKSGSKTERWTKDFLQKAMGFRKYTGRSMHTDLFQTAAGDKYLSLSFVTGTDSITVVGDANYFQRFFDLNRSRKIVHLLVTDTKTVAGHTVSEYVASVTAESDLNEKKYLVETDELRSSNLKIISYSARNNFLSLINIPLVLLGLILGFSCVLIGILFYAFRPIEKIIQQQKNTERQEIYQKALDENLSESKNVQIENPNIQQAKIKLNIQDEHKPLSKPMVAPIEKPVEVKLDFAIDTGSEKNPSTVLSEALRVLSNRMTTEGILIHQDLKSQNQFDFESDRFLKMFEHILNNSIEAVRSATIKNIFVRSYDLNESTVIEIQDSGTGLSEEILEKIWQPYFSTKEKNRHNGLGLSEALSIARRYDGDLTVHNHETGGALVRLTLGGSVLVKMDSIILEKSDELDLDRLLSLDDDETSSSVEAFDLKKEFTATQFKIDHHIEILEDPNIQIQKSAKPMDQFKVQIRGPQKS